MKPFRPMLASKVDNVRLQVRYPVLVSPKLDGIRAIGTKDGLISRSGKPFPNKALNRALVRAQKEGYENPLIGLDGELIAGSPTDAEVFRRTDSLVMSEDAPLEKLTYYVFDLAPSLLDGSPDHLIYEHRSQCIRRRIALLKKMLDVPAKQFKVVYLEQRLADTAEDLLRFEANDVEAGYEGIMLRQRDGLYKEGRSTVREGYLLKLKRFHDSEAEILGFQEKQKNNNEKKTNELGYAKRSSHKANKVGVGTLGALHVRDCKTGVEFDIGTGFDDRTRAAIWAGRDRLIGKVVKYKYFPTGSKERPRFPTFIWFRDKRDMEK